MIRHHAALAPKRLRFGFVPNPTPHEGIQTKELEMLRARLDPRGHSGRVRPPPKGAGQGMA